MQARYAGRPRLQRWLIAAAAVAAFLLLARLRTRGGDGGEVTPPPPPPPDSGPTIAPSGSKPAPSVSQNDTGGWANSFLKDKSDEQLTKLLDDASQVSPLRQCAADRFTLRGSIPALAVQELLLGRDAKGAAAPLGELAVNVTAYGLPCKQAVEEGGSCCKRDLSFRRGTTDLDVFKQVFQCHYMRYFYSMFEGAEPPQYILDAGANVGLSTVLFKLMWPQAAVVSLEPDPSNFEQLKINTQGLENVHTLNAGLWSKRADIVMKASHGAWGKVFREAEKGEKGMPAFGVQDVADKMGLPGFDFVKIDIEGAEGMVFQPGANLDWIKKARLVSLEIHDFFAGYFGLENNDISKRIDAAFSPTGYTIISDNEHILYLAPKLRDLVAKLVPPSPEEKLATLSKTTKFPGC